MKEVIKMKKFCITLTFAFVGIIGSIAAAIIIAYR